MGTDFVLPKESSNDILCCLVLQQEIPVSKECGRKNECQRHAGEGKTHGCCLIGRNKS